MAKTGIFAGVKDRAPAQPGREPRESGGLGRHFNHVRRQKDAWNSLIFQNVFVVKRAVQPFTEPAVRSVTMKRWATK
jgi:hypothetical protein